jgi:hypothetical protein
MSDRDDSRESRWAGYGRHDEESPERYEPMPAFTALPRWLWRKLPRWGRAAVLLLAVAAIAGIAVSIPGIVASKRSTGAHERRLERAARRRVALDQAPRVRALRSGASPGAQLRGAVLGDARDRARRGVIKGPIVSVSCTPVAPARSGRTAYACEAESPAFKYPFLGVTDTVRRTVMWCKRDPPAEQSLDVPVDKRCSL